MIDQGPLSISIFGERDKEDRDMAKHSLGPAEKKPG